MIQPGEAGRTVRSFFDAYLIRRNVKDTLDCVTDTVHWVGTGKSELSKGPDGTGAAYGIFPGAGTDENRV